MICILNLIYTIYNDRNEIHMIRYRFNSILSILYWIVFMLFQINKSGIPCYNTP